MKTLALVMAMALPAAAQSMVGDGGRSPYDPPKRLPFNKHDLIQIAVVEHSAAKSSTNLQSDRRSRMEWDLNSMVQFDLKDGKLLPTVRAADLAGAGNPNLNTDARYRQDNLGNTSQNSDISFTITSEVIEIRPNGNLVIQARKRRKINADEQTITLTGEVSPTAVVNNAVKSDNIANLDISVDGKGSISDGTKPGWFGWLISKLWPF